MSNNSISVITDQQTITSMEIAEILGRQHGHILRDIRVMEPAWEKEAHSKFGLSSYKDKSGKMCPMFILSKTECLFVATKYKDEARAKLVIRWEQLEKERLQGLQAVRESATPSPYPADPRQLTRKQLLLMALEAEEENERLRAEKEAVEAEKVTLMVESGEKDARIAQLEQKVGYLDVIDRQKDTLTITQISQDYGQSAVAFNQLLNGLRVQRRVGEQWVLYADYLDKGYVATRMIPIHHAGSADTYKPVTVWTQRGRRFLYEHLRRHGILPVMERQALADREPVEILVTTGRKGGGV